jgi:hypothetical protein
MKQYITKEQWDEVDKESKYFFQHGEKRPENVVMMLRAELPTIGTMIEFLIRHNRLFVNSGTQTANAYVFSGIKKPTKENTDAFTEMRFSHAGTEPEKEICDNLWETVKEVLKGSDK